MTPAQHPRCQWFAVHVSERRVTLYMTSTHAAGKTGSLPVMTAQMSSPATRRGDDLVTPQCWTTAEIEAAESPVRDELRQLTAQVEQLTVLLEERGLPTAGPVPGS